ncbi:MAG: hypothetical protein GXP35_10675 [Actinobacteria bacterium]|nr:hypothetical protein [Actinomycetota bacterium]
MTTTNEKLAALHERQLGPVGFDGSAGRLIATVDDRPVNIDPDGDALWCSATTDVPRSHSGLVDKQMTADAVQSASADLGGLAALTEANGVVTASVWIDAGSNSVEIATAARDASKMCDFVDQVLEQLETSAVVRAELERLERQVGDNTDDFSSPTATQTIP